MSNFDKAIPWVLKHEGGYVNHPSDPGGETNYGITKRSYPTLDIKNITVDQAKYIYKRDYWFKELDELPYSISAKLFDMSVNMGKFQAIKIAQRAAGVKDDGMIGPKTMEALKDLNVQKMCDEQTRFYKNLATSKPSLKVFLKGWLVRAKWCPQDAPV